MNANIDPRSLLSDRNPFSSRATKPGAIKYRFLNGTGAASLVEDLRTHNWWGEIVGPHGSGKSTLLQAIQESLRAAGRNIHLYTMHRGEKRVAIAGTDLKEWGDSTLVVVDGYEQLGGWNRSMLKKICRQQNTGLLVTAHESMGFPTILRTSVTLDLAQSLVQELLPPECPWIRRDDVADSLDRWNGNLREVFFELYDLYESRRAG